MPVSIVSYRLTVFPAKKDWNGRRS